MAGSAARALSLGILLLFQNVSLLSVNVFAAEANWELRFVNHTSSYPLDLNRNLPFDSKILKGSFLEPSLSAQAKVWGISRNGLSIRDLTLDLRSPKWSYEEGSFLKVQCQNLHAQWKLRELIIQPHDLARLSLLPKKSKPDGKFPDLLEIQGDLQDALARTLAPLFDSAQVEENLTLSAECPSNMRQVLEGVLRAWLADLPRKSPREFAQLIIGIQERLINIKIPNEENSLGLIAKIPLDLLKTSDGNFRSLQIKYNETDHVLRLAFAKDPGSFGLEEGLSSRARELLLSGAPTNGVEWALNDQTLSRLAELAVQEIPDQSPFFRSESGALKMAIRETLNLEDFVPLLPELAPYKDQVKAMRVFIVLETCNERPSPLRLRPFVSQAGANAVDLEGGMSLEFVDAANGRRLAKRHLEGFRLSAGLYSSEAGRLGAQFLGGRAFVGAASSDCLVAAFPPEFVLTVDWLFQGEALRTFMNDKVFSKIRIEIPLPSQSKFRIRQVGETSIASQRDTGGYYSEALLLSLQF